MTEYPRLCRQLDELASAGTSKLTALGQALQRFQNAGKTVVAFGHHFTQDQYQPGAMQTKSISDPMGMVIIDGFSTRQLYLNDAPPTNYILIVMLRVGQFKSVAEPYIRNNMSEQAKKPIDFGSTKSGINT